MKQYYIYTLVIALFTTINSIAQVTIGSHTPPKAGALLDLNEDINGLSTKGLLLPRVELHNLNELKIGSDIDITDEKEKKKHTGLIVYNVKTIETDIRVCPGLHTWTGSKWQPIKEYAKIDPPTVSIKKVHQVLGRQSLLNTNGFTPGLLGAIVDIRGPSKDEVNIYQYTRFYTDSVTATTTIAYTGVRNINTCDPIPVIEEWEETKKIKFLDDGVWMNENLNTLYVSSTATTPLVLHTGNSNTVAQYRRPNNINSPSANQIRINGVLYNYEAATNSSKTSLSIDQSPGYGSPNLTADNIEYLGEQGICPDGWHLPSDYEWTILETAIAQNPSLFTQTTTGTTPAIAQTYEYGFRPSMGTRGHGKSMKTTTPLGGKVTNGDSKTSAESGFNAPLVGDAINGTSTTYGQYGYFWSSSTYSNTMSWMRGLPASNVGVARMPNSRTYLLSVRCRKDVN